MFIFLCILVAVILFSVGNIIYCSSVLTFNEYDVESTKVRNDIRFVAISDTEGKTFGEHNQRLAEKIEEANPEFVLILGDMVNRTNGDYTDVVALCKSLAKKYPVYYTLGNHECLDFEGYENYLQNLSSAINNTGAHMLINEMADIYTESGERVTLAGLKTFPFYEFDAPDYDNEENHLFQKYLAQEDNDHFSILMCHQPETYVWGLENYNIDLMMSGHTHGGVVRLPFIGGLYAPEQGYFPKYSKGYYSNGKASMIISAGLGKARDVPRFLNPPDVTIVNIKAK